ncbi:amino acid adenylation domain-containing protein [Pseudomonas sp. GD03858]|uniref:amino acid adenylation domain-containing protein n=1 Tax=unclassified Pseudomonas TaxID=196821 RepID=UPI00244A1B76|nr:MULTISPECIES: amino acid adenylation domain-containing protein [unclassified Pseudomonas]MDH0645351.1 amino acid adenylation domain-containing protein [Pseudomonas sp. GD03867]MDH0660973.1 amino acid adenylation domain-containing protein [Pseudomonas sp. GD03858]
MRYLPDGHAGAAPVPAILWHEAVAGQSGDAIAVAHCRAQLRKPLSSSSPAALRAVLLEYEDEVCDLILVGRRSQLDLRSLMLLGDALLGGSELALRLVGEPAAGTCLLDDESLEDERFPVPEWALGEPDQAPLRKRFRLALAQDEIGSTASWLAALAVTLSRYSDMEPCEVATLVIDSQRSPYALDACERLVHLPISLESQGLCAGLLEDIEARLPRLEQAPAGPLKAFVPAMIMHDAQADLVPFSDYQSSLSRLYSLLFLRARDAEGQAYLECSYHCRGFDGEVIRHFARSLVFVHQQLLANPQHSVQSLHLLSDKHALEVGALGRTVRGADSLQRIEQVFAEQARAYPDALALSFEGQKLSYQALDQQSSQWAHVLRAEGVVQGDLVGVCLERSLELVVMLLAVLKAGATYVPLDPAYPAERLGYAVENARISLVVSTLSEFPTPVRLLSPQAIIERSVDYPSVAPAITGDAQAPAYVIYTSGSTGKPKGVVVRHCNLMSLLAGTQKDFKLSASDTWTLFHSSAFDFSVWEMWGCLLTGGHLVVVPYWVSRSAREFHQLLVRERVSVLNQTPSAFSQLIEADEHSGEPLALRLVVFGGEPLDARMLVRWFDRHPESACRMVNMFGITETTVHVTAQTITRREALKATRSVGRPVDGWHVYIMDEAGRLLPPGISGEICVAGAGVALEYLNQPQLTAERFITRPCDTGRLYRSGDKGRLRPDGRLEHLGRLDSQVKLRGFRIELDEIRSVLLQANAVVAAAVVLNQGKAGDAASARLDAYLVLNGGSVQDVRQHAGKFLPDYMLPSTFTVLDVLPLTANGKLDVRALPAPMVQVQSLQSQKKAVADGDAVTMSLVAIWEAVLGVPVGLDDNFFALGGNSLYAVRIDAMLREQHLPSIPMREIYIQQTIRNLLGFLHASGAEQSSVDL